VLSNEKDLQDLKSSTAIIGYCAEVCIQLGIESRLDQYTKVRAAGAAAECLPMEGSMGLIAFNFNPLSCVGFSLANLHVKSS
jgi:hypothetical protein